MDRLLAHTSDALLAQVNCELERISEAQHRLARTKAVLQEQATRLRLGASPAQVRLVLEAVTTVSGDTDLREAAWPLATGPGAAGTLAGGRQLVNSLSRD